jgi:hypothetical protein
VPQTSLIWQLSQKLNITHQRSRKYADAESAVSRKPLNVRRKKNRNCLVFETRVPGGADLKKKKPRPKICAAVPLIPFTSSYQIN